MMVLTKGCHSVAAKALPTGDLDGAVLLAGAAGVACESGLGRAGAVGDDADDVKPFGLVGRQVGRQLDEEVVARVAGYFEGFFDSAWHPG